MYFERTSFPVPVPKIMGYLISGQVPMKKLETHHIIDNMESTQRTRKRAAGSLPSTSFRFSCSLLLYTLLCSFCLLPVFLLPPFFTFSLFPVQFCPFSPSYSPFSSFFLLPFVVTFVYSPCGAFFLLYCSSLSNACIGSANNCKLSLSYLSSDKNIIPLSPS